MSSGRILQKLSLAVVQAIDTVETMSAPLGAGLTGKAVIEATRGFEANDAKDTIKNMTAVGSSIVNLGIGLKANHDMAKILFQVWPHLSRYEKLSVGLLVVLSNFAQVYASELFGREQNILAATYATTASILCLKGIETFLLFKQQSILANLGNEQLIEHQEQEEVRFTV